MHVEHDLIVAVSQGALGDPIVGAYALWQAQAGATRHQMHILRKGHARFQLRHDPGDRAGKTAVTQHHDIAGIKQGKAFANRLNRVGQIAAGGVGGALGLCQFRVGLVQQFQRVFQFPRAGAHGVFQQDGPLKLRIGGVGIVVHLLDPPDQRSRDCQQFFILPQRAVGRIDQRLCRHVTTAPGG